MSYTPLVLSKTVWAAVVLAALSAFDTQFQEMIKNNPGWFGSGISFLMIFLRILTTGKLVLRGPNDKDNN